VRRILALIFLFLILIVNSQAQTAKAPSDNSQASAKTSDLPALTGCLSYKDDHYILTEEDGATHQLAGAAGKLGHHVGHEIEVTGKPGIRSVDSTLVGGASSIVEQPVFEVKTVKHIDNTCKPGS
jgi:hypothetical protein